MDQYPKLPWTVGGLELLQIIEQIIYNEGGRDVLAIKITSEIKRFRTDRYQPPDLPKIRRSYRVILAQKDRQFKRFIGTHDAATYLGTNIYNLHTCIKKGCRCKGWRVKYVYAQDI